MNSWWQFYGGSRRYDADLELYLTPHRSYPPILGRWLTPDPAGQMAVDPANPQTWNMYAYAGNNPTTNTDPTGLYCVQGAGGGWYDDGNGGQTCAESEAPETVNVTTQAPALSYLTASYIDFLAFQYNVAQRLLSLPVQSAQQAYTGFSNLFLNNKPEGAVPLALGIAGMGLIPEEAEIEGVLTRAESAVGDETITVSSEDVAKEAADRFLGPGKEPIVDRETGAFAGWKSTNGERVVIDTHTDAGTPQPHMNFHNKVTGGNLHVRW